MSLLVLVLLYNSKSRLIVTALEREFKNSERVWLRSAEPGGVAESVRLLFSPPTPSPPSLLLREPAYATLGRSFAPSQARPPRLFSSSSTSSPSSQLPARSAPRTTLHALTQSSPRTLPPLRLPLPPRGSSPQATRDKHGRSSLTLVNPDLSLTTLSRRRKWKSTLTTS